jgi:predicted amidohydrolase
MLVRLAAESSQADIDLAQVAKVRNRIPSLKNERAFTLEQQ